MPSTSFMRSWAIQLKIMTPATKLTKTAGLFLLFRKSRQYWQNIFAASLSYISYSNSFLHASLRALPFLAFGSESSQPVVVEASLSSLILCFVLCSVPLKIKIAKQRKTAASDHKITLKSASRAFSYGIYALFP